MGQIPVFMHGNRGVSADLERASIRNQTFADKITPPEVENYPKTPA